ncbi:MAG: site-specific DNA-methyltransferase [Saprospiraceae bacterium]|nr:site-specific DNA-methyltransferase [Saprospiraceae bacterium]
MIKRRNEYDIFIKDYLERNDEIRTKKPKSIWVDKEVNTEAGGKLLKQIFPNSGFSYPKPIGLLNLLIRIAGIQNEIILDFFAGSATAAHAVMELNKEDNGNRKYICVQIPEPIDENSEAHKAGYKTIADISKERIRRVSANIRKELDDKKAKANATIFGTDESDKNDFDLGFKVFKLARSNFKLWDNTFTKNTDTVERNLFEHIDHISDASGQESILYELLLKSGFELTTSIQKMTLADKAVFNIDDGKLLICLEKELTHECIKAMAEAQPIRAICLDEAFIGENADALKTNAVQIMKSKDVVFRTV